MKRSTLLNFDKEDKLQIIISLYEAMVSYSQELRATVERLTIWGCGLILLAVGWLVTTPVSITTTAKVVIAIGVASFIIVIYLVIRSLQNRYGGFAIVIRNINEVQMVYETGTYLENKNLFPDHWKAFGSKEWKEPIFDISYISLAVVGLFSLAVVLFVI